VARVKVDHPVDILVGDSAHNTLGEVTVRVDNRNTVPLSDIPAAPVFR
jgi:hypothetical protein